MGKYNEITGSFFFKNDTPSPISAFDDGFLNTGINVYEVLRVINSVPLFLEDHCKRFSNSLKGKGIDFSCSGQQFKHYMEKVINENRLEKGNIKIVFHHDPVDESFLIVYPVPHVYPTNEDYISGVIATTIEEERPDPEFKNWRPGFKENIKRLKDDSGSYELILFTHDGIITEGSQSNLFFIKKGKIITAKKERILPGITRKYVYQICNRFNIDIIEKDFSVKDLAEFESAFLSGTSPKILPLLRIDEHFFDVVNPVLKRIMEEYDIYIEEYLANY